MALFYLLPKACPVSTNHSLKLKFFFFFFPGNALHFLFFFKKCLIFCSLSHHRILIKLCSIISCTQKKPKSESSIQLLLFSSRKELHLIFCWKLYFIFMLGQNINLRPMKELSFYFVLKAPLPLPHGGQFGKKERVFSRMIEYRMSD